MSIEHLKLLKNALESNKWLVVSESEGNDYDIAAYWEVARPSGAPTFTIAFNGLDDMQTLPIEQAFGCYVIGKTEISCYFAKVNKSFKVELDNFIKAVLNDIT